MCEVSVISLRFADIQLLHFLFVNSYLSTPRSRLGSIAPTRWMSKRFVVPGLLALKHPWPEWLHLALVRIWHAPRASCLAKTCRFPQWSSKHYVVSCFVGEYSWTFLFGHTENPQKTGKVGIRYQLEMTSEYTPWRVCGDFGRDKWTSFWTSKEAETDGISHREVFGGFCQRGAFPLKNRSFAFLATRGRFDCQGPKDGISTQEMTWNITNRAKGQEYQY